MNLVIFRELQVLKYVKASTANIEKRDFEKRYQNSQCLAGSPGSYPYRAFASMQAKQSLGKLFYFVCCLFF